MTPEHEELVWVLRDMAQAYPEDIFPTPPPEKRVYNAAAADVLRRVAVPHFTAAADVIEDLAAEVEALRSVVRLLRVETCIRPVRGVASHVAQAPLTWFEPLTHEQRLAIERALEAET